MRIRSVSTDLGTLQIYFLIFAQYPFQGYGLDGLIGNMINFVEDLPAEWRPRWEEVKRTTTNTLDGTLGEYLHAPTARVMGPDVMYVEDEKPEVPRLEQSFRDLVHEPKLQCLLPIMKGLLKFLPENRISAGDAFNLVLLQEAVTKGFVDSHEDP